MYLLALFAGFSATAGCGNVRTMQPPIRNTTLQTLDRFHANHDARAETDVALVRNGVVDSGLTDPAATALALADRLERNGVASPDDTLALAEMFYRAGLSWQRRDTSSALRQYRNAAVLAVLAMSDPGLPRPYSALELHNRALARIVRLSQKTEGLPWQDAVTMVGLSPVGTTHYLAADRFEKLTVCEDVVVTGMQHIFANGGIGVPIVAHRTVRRNSDDVQDQYLPIHLRAVTTAMVVPGGGLAGGAWRNTPASLTLYDPFEVRSVRVGSKDVILASDRTTPLALQVADRNLRMLEISGLLQSQFRDGIEAGLFMLRPYQPGKIPVVLVHGLFSSPRAFAQTINELRNDPVLTQRYQFWVFLYATGQPIPRSAQELRRALALVRSDFDPAGNDAALDRMVLVGHSMGGILSKMMVQDTGNKLWEATIRLPIEQLKATEGTKRELSEMLVFKPVPSIKRVVFIATPHRGSELANELLGRVVSSLVQRPSEQQARMAELEQLNGKDVIHAQLRPRTLNSIGNLRTDSPVLITLDRLPVHPTVPYHSIIPQVTGTAGTTDAVVRYTSSHMPGSDSEIILPGTHFSQQHPIATAELKRILTLHLETP